MGGEPVKTQQRFVFQSDDNMHYHAITNPVNLSAIVLPSAFEKCFTPFYNLYNFKIFSLQLSEISHYRKVVYYTGTCLIPNCAGMVEGVFSQIII
jgi:hypothetical protein